MACGCGTKKKVSQLPVYRASSNSQMTVLAYFNNTVTVETPLDSTTYNVAELISLPTDVARALLSQEEPPIFIRRASDKELLRRLYPELEGKL